MNEEIIVRARCADEEKKDLLKIVILMTAIAAKCRRDGLLALAEVKEADEIPFLKIAIQLILKGYEVHKIESILENIIYAEQRMGKVLLEKILIFKAMRMILSGYNISENVKKSLLCILGEPWLYGYQHSDELNNKILRMVYQIAYKLTADDLATEAINEKVFEWMEGSSTYAALYNAMNDLLKSQAFLTPIASIYLLYENKAVFDEWIDSSTEKILKVIDERLLSKIVEKTQKIDFIDVRTDIRGKLSTLIFDGYIDFEQNAELALNRVLLSPAIPNRFKIEHAKYGLSHDLVGHVGEFMKILLSGIDERGNCFDFQACKSALIKTIAERKLAEEVKTK